MALQSRCMNTSLSGRIDPFRHRYDTHSAEALRAQDERDNALYAALLLRASDGGTSLEELYLDACRLASQQPREALREEAERYIRNLERRSRLYEQLAEQDSEGNPLWISLTLRERRDDGRVEAPGVLPSGLEVAVPKDHVTEKREEKDPESGLFGLVVRLLRRLTRSGVKRPQSPLKSRGVVPPPDPSPMRGFFRMLLLGAAMALAWYVLQRYGIVSSLF